MSDEHDQMIVGAEGVVRWFDDQLGYGFIAGPDDQDIFAHYTSIVGERGSGGSGGSGEGRRVLRKGAVVQYDAERTDKGWRAVRVERLAMPQIVQRKARSVRRAPSRRPPTG